MDLVHSWALQRTPRDFLRSVPGSGGEAERWGALIGDHMTSTASRTTDTIRHMVASNLGFMVDPVLREAATPGPGMFSPRDFVREGRTLYLIAESRDDRPSPVAGLFAALVIEIYHQATLAAAGMPGGRLDLPMLWAGRDRSDLPAADPGGLDNTKMGREGRPQPAARRHRPPCAWARS